MYTLQFKNTIHVGVGEMGEGVKKIKTKQNKKTHNVIYNCSKENEILIY